MKIVGQSSLIDGVIATTWDKYALQMALKLLVAQHVQTEQYVTLDADVIIVGDLNMTQLLPDGRAAQSI